MSKKQEENQIVKNNDTQNVEDKKGNDNKSTETSISQIDFSKYISDINTFSIDNETIKSSDAYLQTDDVKSLDQYNNDLITNKEGDELIKSLVSENDVNNDKKTKKWITSGGVFSFFLVFSVVLLLITYVFSFILIPIKVVGISMQPTINSSYYYVYEGINDDGTPIIKYKNCDIVYYKKSKSYKNNDIVIVENNGYISDDEVTSLIKRVIACPEQIVKFELTSIDDSLENYYYRILVLDKSGKDINLDQSYAKNIDNMYITKTYLNDEENINKYPFFCSVLTEVINKGEYLYKVPKNKYFVIGDNRTHSTDSRYFGPVKIDDISGSVRLIVAYNQNLFKAIIIKIKSYF